MTHKTRAYGRDRMLNQIAKKKPPEISQNYDVWFTLKQKANRRKLRGARVKPHNRKRGYK